MTKNQQKRHSNKIILWVISVAILIFIVIPLIVISNVIDSYALVVKTARVDVNSAVKAKKVARQFRDDLYGYTANIQHSSLQLTENDINGIIALGMRGIKRLKGRVNVTPLGIKGAFTFELPNNPFGKYINFTGTIIPSQDGLNIHNVSLGNIELPGGLAVSLAEVLLNQMLTGKATGTKLVNSIDSITVDNSRLTLIYHTIPNIRQIFEETKERVKKIRDDLALLGDPKLVKLYYHKLCDFNKQGISFAGKTVPLGLYLNTAFSFAEKRSNVGKNPVDENKASLLALSIFLGTTNFNSIIGAIDKKTLRKCQPRGRKIVLNNRVDLRLHFIYSAGLKVISDSGISFTIGEYKELLDSQEGGSGFSFADLAADRSGIRFAEQAMDSFGAMHIQRMAAELIQKKVFFPSIAGFPEGMPQHLFEQRGGIEGDYYKKYLAMINERIENLPLYSSQY